ncbi:MAG: hypothetical protein ACRDQZ_25505 [Mycobacteriales bacterium]
MNALEFANRTTGERVIEFSLLKRAEMVKKLRELADRIEADKYPKLVLQEAHSAEKVKHDDFAITTLVLSFAELHEASTPGTALRGGGGNLVPVEVA